MIFNRSFLCKVFLYVCFSQLVRYSLFGFDDDDDDDDYDDDDYDDYDFGSVDDDCSVDDGDDEVPSS